jgi:hypothetical protein
MSSRVPSYAAVLRTPHAARTFGAALIGRLSYGVVFLSLRVEAALAVGSVIGGLAYGTVTWRLPGNRRLPPRH